MHNLEKPTKVEMRIMITNTLRTLFLVLFITKALSQECIVTNEVMDTAVEITESSDIVLSMYDYIEYEDCIQECCNEENCSLVMYMEESIECVLIDCSVGECVTVSTEGSTVIYVSHTNDPTTTPSTPHLTTINATAYTHSSLLPTESSDYQINSTEHLIENSTATTNHTDILSNNGEDMTNRSEISETHGDTSTNDIGISTENNVNSTNNYVNSTETLKTGAGLTSVQSTVTSSTYAIGNLTNKNTLHSGLTLAQNTTPTSVGDNSTSASESVSSSTYTGRTSLSSLSSLSTLISTLLSKTSTKAALVTSANTAAMNNSTSLGSFSTSSSFILSSLATNLPIIENVTFLQNHSLSITHNGTNDNGTKVSTKILDENVTIASTTPNVLSVTVNNTHYDSESMASSTVLISESTSSVTPGSTSKQSTVSEVPSSHSSSSWWLYNMSSVSSTLPLLKTSLSSLVSTVSSLPTTASIEHSSSGNSRAPTSSSALSSSGSTSMSSRTSAWSESTVSSSESSYITSTSSDTNKTAHEKISSSGSDSDQMSGTLIAILCVGIVFTFAVGLLFGQRVYDAWQRRHYNKLDYLINGMYG